MWRVKIASIGTRTRFVSLESGALPACPFPTGTLIVCRAVYLFVHCAHFIALSNPFHYKIIWFTAAYHLYQYEYIIKLLLVKSIWLVYHYYDQRSEQKVIFKVKKHLLGGLFCNCNKVINLIMFEKRWQKVKKVKKVKIN